MHFSDFFFSDIMQYSEKKQQRACPFWLLDFVSNSTSDVICTGDLNQGSPVPSDPWIFPAQDEIQSWSLGTECLEPALWCLFTLLCELCHRTHFLLALCSQADVYVPWSKIQLEFLWGNLNFLSEGLNGKHYIVLLVVSKSSVVNVLKNNCIYHQYCFVWKSSCLMKDWLLSA